MTDAKKLAEEVLKARMIRLGAVHLDTLTSMHNLALAFREQGRWADAEELEAQVLETRKIKLGPEHPDTLSSMNNLSIIWTS